MKRNLLRTWRTQGGSKRLRELRTAQGLTLDGLALKVGVSKGTLSKLENPNLRPNPGLDTIQAVAEALGVKREELFDPTPVGQKEQQGRGLPTDISLELYLRELKPSPANARKFHLVATHPVPPKTVPEWRRFTEWLVLFTGRDPRPAGTRVHPAAKVRAFPRA